MTDSAGQVVWKADYRPFGEEQAVAGTVTNDRKLVGKEKDEETGLYYFGARYENAKIGRFIAPDPVRAVDAHTSKTNEMLLHNPQRLNTYAYGLNNPYRYIDPDGNTAWDILDVGFFTHSLYKFCKEPSWSNAGDLGLNTVGLLPIVPSIGVIKAVGEGALKGIKRIDPFAVRFSQESAGYTFRGRGTIDDLATGLRNGSISPDNVPPIRLVERDGNLFSLDNRRLEAFRRAGVQAPYRMATKKEAASEGWKFTTRNKGISIRIRGE